MARLMGMKNSEKPTKAQNHMGKSTSFAYVQLLKCGKLKEEKRKFNSPSTLYGATVGRKRFEKVTA